jgi:hypothetical protein
MWEYALLYANLFFRLPAEERQSHIALAGKMLLESGAAPLDAVTNTQCVNVNCLTGWQTNEAKKLH